MVFLLKTTIDLPIFSIEYRAEGRSKSIIIYESQCHVWTLQYSFWNGGSKKYTVFICWSKLNKVGVEVHRFSWPSGLNHCFFASHSADGVSSNPSSVNHILPLYSFFENNFNKFAFRVINLEI